MGDFPYNPEDQDLCCGIGSSSNSNSKKSILQGPSEPSAFRYVDSIIKIFKWDFPGGAVVKNPPANAGDTDSSPGP